MARQRPVPPRTAKMLPKEASGWGIHQIQVWCREQLGGAPPAKPIEKASGIELKWAKVKFYAGKMLVLDTDFKGGVFDGRFQFAPTLPMTITGTRKSGGEFGFHNIANHSAIDNINEALEKFWKGIDELLIWYNQTDIPTMLGGMMWGAGKVMHDIKQEVNSLAHPVLDTNLVSNDNMRYSVYNWGVGHPKQGYGITIVENSLKVYYWLPDADESHPIFPHRSTPIMKLIRAESKDSNRRTNLFEAYDSGPLKGIADDQLNWALGLSEKTFPLPDRWGELRALCDKIADGVALSGEQEGALTSILTEAFSSAGNVDYPG